MTSPLQALKDSLDDLHKPFSGMLDTGHKVVIDGDDVNTINAEEKAYKAWERETKNHILSMSNTERKQVEWTKHFPPVEEANDDWLLNGDIF